MSRLTFHCPPVSLLARSVFGLSLCLLGTGFSYGLETAPATESTPTAEIAVTETSLPNTAVALADAPAAAPVAEAKPADIAVAETAPPAVEAKPADTAEVKPADTKDSQPGHADRSHRGRGPMGSREAGSDHKSGRPLFGGMSRSSGGPSGRHFGGLGSRPEDREKGDRSEHSRYGIGHGSRGFSHRFDGQISNGQHRSGFGPHEFGGHRGSFSPHGGSHRGHTSMAHNGGSHRSGIHGDSSGVSRGPSSWGERSGSQHSMSHFSGGPGRGFGQMAFLHGRSHSAFGPGRHHGAGQEEGHRGDRHHRSSDRKDGEGQHRHGDHPPRDEHRSGEGHHDGGSHDGDSRGR